MTKSFWKSIAMPQFLPLSHSIKVDVLIVGGGNTGIVTAYLLKKAGLRVALIERDRCAQLNTGNTTSHLTCVTDLRLEQLVKNHGRDHAEAVWDAGLAAINQIQDIIGTEKIACEFMRVPGYLHTSIIGDKDETGQLQREAALAQELGFPAEFVRQVPVFGRPGIRFANQAKFHPLMYLAELVTRIPGDGSHVCELTEAGHFDGSDEFFVRVTANEHVITCQQVVIATDVPLTGISSLAGAALFQTKLAPYTSYALGAKLPKDTAPIATFWDTSDPYYFLRVDRMGNEDYAIFGGQDHKTGQAEQTSDFFADLEKQLHRFLPTAQVDRRWSGQVIESHDGLPLIGQTEERQFVATGFAGNGITFGTVAGMMIRDAIVGRQNPWSELFAASRLQTRGGIWNYLTENIDYPYYMLKDRLLASESQLYAEAFSEAEKEKITRALKEVISTKEFAIDEIWGEQIEDRGSQITFSALGQQAPLEKKRQWDPEFTKRQQIKARLAEAIPEFTIRLGGTTSIDVTKLGIDKAYGIEKLREHLGIEVDEMLFFGDAIFPGGNDYPVQEAGVVSTQVDSAEETKRVIEKLIESMNLDHPNHFARR